MPENQNQKKIPLDLQIRLYSNMVLARKFEEKIVNLSKEPYRLPGMQILANGQEAVSTGIVLALKPEDVVITNHRSHGHLLARGANPNTLMAEIMAKATGVNGGKAGTLHLAVPEVNVLMTSTVVGAGPPLALGPAFAQQYRGDGGITVVFFGDGAAAEGSVHEAMNMAGVWKLPLLFVCENNSFAGAQRLLEHSATQDIFKRADGYDMPGKSVDGNDVEAVYTLAKELIEHCRSGRGPALMEARTYRMRGHGEQDHQHYVDPKELEAWAAKCPIKSYRKKLLERGIVDEKKIRDIDREAEVRVTEAVEFGDQSPYPGPETLMTNLFFES